MDTTIVIDEWFLDFTVTMTSNFRIQRLGMHCRVSHCSEVEE